MVKRRIWQPDAAESYRSNPRLYPLYKIIPFVNLKYLFRRPYLSHCLMVASVDVAFRVLSGLNCVRKIYLRACKNSHKHKLSSGTQINRKPREQSKNRLYEGGVRADPAFSGIGGICVSGLSKVFTAAPRPSISKGGARSGASSP